MFENGRGLFRSHHLFATQSSDEYLVFPIQKVSLQDFTIDAFINFKSNILYSFGKE